MLAQLKSAPCCACCVGWRRWTPANGHGLRSRRSCCGATPLRQCALRAVIHRVAHVLQACQPTHPLALRLHGHSDVTKMVCRTDRLPRSVARHDGGVDAGRNHIPDSQSPKSDRDALRNLINVYNELIAECRSGTQHVRSSPVARGTAQAEFRPTTLEHLRALCRDLPLSYTINVSPEQRPSGLSAQDLGCYGGTKPPTTAELAAPGGQAAAQQSSSVESVC